MELQGFVKQVLAKRSGTSQSGRQWESQEFVLSIPGQYEKNVIFSLFGADKIANANLVEGVEVLVKFDIDAHEVTMRDGSKRWFNNVNAWEVSPVGQQQQQYQQPTQAQPQQPTTYYQSQPTPPQQFPPQVNTQGQPAQQQQEAAPIDDGLPFN